MTSLALGAMDAVSSPRTGGSSIVGNESMLLETMVMLGASGPALTGGAMVLLYEIGMALFVGLGRLFIMCLLSEQTKQLFQRWLMYGLGTMFSLAVLYVLKTIAMRPMEAVCAMPRMEGAARYVVQNELATKSGGLYAVRFKKMLNYSTLQLQCMEQS